MQKNRERNNDSKSGVKKGLGIGKLSINLIFKLLGDLIWIQNIFTQEEKDEPYFLVFN